MPFLAEVVGVEVAGPHVTGDGTLAVGSQDDVKKELSLAAAAELPVLGPHTHSFLFVLPPLNHQIQILVLTFLSTSML